MSSSDKAEKPISKKRPILSNSFLRDEAHSMCDLLSDLMRGADVTKYRKNRNVHSSWQKFLKMRQKSDDWEKGTLP